ncbi:MAG: DUF4440 domain-containing protein [Wenzhouxiangellaceae bacterium]|nr:MAG: DUF4440 domain-containing protein [Wenzhouxiangellaceae bacterium]
MGTVSSIEEKAIRATLDRAADALRDKDLDALSLCYFSDVEIFDIGSHSTGFRQLRKLLKSCFPYFPEPIEIQRRNLRIICSDGVAVVTSLTRMDRMKTDHPSGRAWTRTTTCLKKVNNEWKIFHEHASMPVDCAQDRIDYLFDPD